MSEVRSRGLVARPPRPASSPRRSRPAAPGRVPAALLAAVAVAAAGAGWAATRDRAVGGAPGDRTAASVPSPPGRPAPTPPAASGPADPVRGGDPVAALRALDARRAAAFAAADPGALAGVYAPGSAALRADDEAVRGYAAAGRRVRRLRHVLVRVRVLARGADRARLLVTDRLPAYQVVDAAGRAAARPGRGPATWEVALVRTAAGWRIASLARAG